MEDDVARQKDRGALPGRKPTVHPTKNKHSAYRSAGKEKLSGGRLSEEVQNGQACLVSEYPRRCQKDGKPWMLAYSGFVHIHMEGVQPLTPVGSSSWSWWRMWASGAGHRTNNGKNEKKKYGTLGTQSAIYLLLCR